MKVVDNDGLHSTIEKAGAIGLKAGKHAITVNFFELTGDQELSVSYDGPGIVKQTIPLSSLFRVGTTPTFSDIHINFQPATVAVPAGYISDIGETYAVRTGGYSYGWNAPTIETRYRLYGIAPDVKSRTFTHLQKPTNPNAMWELAIPNGAYTVHFLAGDPEHTDMIENFDVEGIAVIDPDGQDNFDEYTVNVMVADQKLTIKPGTGSLNTKINYIDISKSNSPRHGMVDNELYENKLTVSPIPSNDLVDVKYVANLSGNLTIELISNLSIPVLKQTNYVSAGENIFQLDLHEVNNGLYTLITSQNGVKLTARVLIIK